MTALQLFRFEYRAGRWAGRGRIASAIAAYRWATAPLPF